jgi:uncharacterized protein
METKEYQVKLGHAPALFVFKNTREEAAANGTILFYHGLRAAKETNRKELNSLAERGFLAVGIDNIGHGERIYHNFDDHSSSKNSFEHFFLDMVQKTVNEVPEIIDELIKNGLGDKLGISGISMGGYIAYGAVMTDKRLKVAAPILGSPKWKSSIEKSPHNHPEKFFPTAMLSQNAGKDESVPPVFAREFHECLVPYYKEAPDRLKYIEYPESNHFMIESDWNILWENVLEWFDRFLI